MICQDTFNKKMAMSPSSTVHGGQHDARYVTFELLMHAAFVADEIWGFMLEPARSVVETRARFFRQVSLAGVVYVAGSGGSSRKPRR